MTTIIIIVIFVKIKIGIQTEKMKKASTQSMVNNKFFEDIKSFMGENANLCYQCKKCSVGCPVINETDYSPHQIIHALRLGMKDLVLNSKMIWLCVACETCTTRCPQGVDIVKIMDASRIFNRKEKVPPGIKEIPAFHKSVLQIISIFGRMYEFGVVILLKLRTKGFTKDINMGLRLIKIKKLALLPDLATLLKINRMFARALKMEKNSL